MKKVLALLCALLSTPVAAQVIPSGPWGSLNYWGVGGASQVLNPGTPGYCLETQGTGSAPVWIACPGSALNLLPGINTNQFYGNVSGQFGPPVGVDVNTILNTVGYDIARPPSVESIIYKSNVGPTFNWQALPPGTQGSLLTSGGPTNPPFWSPNTIQANLTGICTTIGAVLYFDTPSNLWKCLNPGTGGQVLQTNGPGANPSYLSLSGTAPITYSGGVIGITGNALTSVNDTNVTVSLGGTPANALVQPVSITMGWNGLLSIARGGTAGLLAANPNPSDYNPFTNQLAADVANAPATTGAIGSGTGVAAAGGATGHSYAVGDTLTVVGGTGTAATFKVQTVSLTSVAVNAGGSGYNIGDQLQLFGGTFFLNAFVQVTSVSSGAITGVSIVAADPGYYTVTASSFTSGAITGSGTGATFNTPIWGVGTVTSLAAGNYSVFPTNPVATTDSGAGTGATLNVLWGNAPKSLRTSLGYPTYVQGFTTYGHQPCTGFQLTGNNSNTVGPDGNFYVCNNNPQALYPGQSYIGGDGTTLSFGAAQNVTFQTTDSTRNPVNNASNVLATSFFNLYKLPLNGATGAPTFPANGSGLHAVYWGSSSTGPGSLCNGGTCAVDTNYAAIAGYVVNNVWASSQGRIDFSTACGSGNNCPSVDIGLGLYSANASRSGLLADPGAGFANFLGYSVARGDTNAQAYTLRSTAGELAFYNNSLAADQWAFGVTSGGLYAIGATGTDKGSGTINTKANGYYMNGTQLNFLCAPNVQVLTTGTNATYTTPTCNGNLPLYLEIEEIGAGGGGAGSGTSPGAATNGGATCWNTSGTACTSPVYQAAGGTAGNSTAGTLAAGGAVSGSGSCDDGFTGASGGPASNQTNTVGGYGAPGPLGGAGAAGFGTVTAGAATAPGAGGGGAGDGGTANTGGGGAAGALCRGKLPSPAASYVYTIGAAGTGGTLGTSGAAGGSGFRGQIKVRAAWN